MSLLFIILRLIHIFSGVFWAGTAFFFVSVLEPTIEASGPEGGKVMQRLAQSRFPIVLPIAALLTVLSGLVMYWLDSGGLQAGWITSGTGLGFTIGAVAGLAAFVIGVFISRPAVARLGLLAQQVQASGGPPTPAQGAEIQALQKRTSQSALWTAILLALALIGMSIARYL